MAESGEMGHLGICYLKRFWSQRMAAFSQTSQNSLAPGDLGAERVLLAGLRLGLRETVHFLTPPLPNFEELRPGCWRRMAAPSRRSAWRG